MEAGEDCEVDDPELMFSKKHLTRKLTPLSVVRLVMDKHKEIEIIENIEQVQEGWTQVERGRF